jgi:tetratricopeptide (TPR) repeat protein
MVANGYISGDPSREYFTDLAIHVTKPGFNPIDAMSWPVMGNSTFAGYEPSRVWRNEGNEVFKELAVELGLADTGDGRGLAIADFDGDGDLDVYISNQGQDGVLYRNEIGSRNNWLQVDLVGTTCNRDAIGARVTLVSEGSSQVREVNGGNGDHSQCPYRLHFGLGQRKAIDRLEVRWPNGYVQRLTGIRPNRILKITDQTPAEHLAERKRWKEAQLEARRLEIEREKRMAEAEAAPADEVPQEWQDTVKFKREYLKFKAAIQKNPDDPQKRYEFAMLLDTQGRRSAALRELERAVQIAPDRLIYANTYRTLVRRYGHLYFDRAIRFFEDLAEKYPDSTMARLNKALVYVDKMPYPKLGIVHQGILSNKSLQVLDGILAEDPTCWTAKFIRGMNHLHWPRMLGHAPLAIIDFTELIEMQKTLSLAKQRDHFALAYVALGDSYVKNRANGLEENLARARQTWEAGLKEHPDRPELKKRLELAARSGKELVSYVKKQRGLEDPVNTDLAQVWGDAEDTL